MFANPVAIGLLIVGWCAMGAIGLALSVRHDSCEADAGLGAAPAFGSLFLLCLGPYTLWYGLVGRSWLARHRTAVKARADARHNEGRLTPERVRHIQEHGGFIAPSELPFFEAM